MNFNLIKIYSDLATNVYHVDPRIFVFLMIASLPFYYYGWIEIARSSVKFAKKYRDKKSNIKISDIITETDFIIPMFINRSAWVMPYVYVIFWGKNIPLWFWVLFIGWIVLGSYLFWENLKKKIV